MQSRDRAVPHTHPCVGVALQSLRRHGHSGGCRPGQQMVFARSAAVQPCYPQWTLHALNGPGCPSLLCASSLPCPLTPCLCRPCRIPACLQRWVTSRQRHHVMSVCVLCSGLG